MRHVKMYDFFASLVCGILYGSCVLSIFCNAELSEEHFIVIQASRLQTTYHQIVSVSMFQCTVLCSQDSNCKSVNFSPSNRICEVSALSDVAIATDIETEPGWNVYTTEPGKTSVIKSLYKNHSANLLYFGSLGLQFYDLN